MFVIHQKSADTYRYICTFGSFETEEEAKETVEFYEKQDAEFDEDCYDKRFCEDVFYEIEELSDASEIHRFNYFEV